MCAGNQDKVGSVAGSTVDAPDQRVVLLERGFNVRDLGGLTTRDGRLLRSGRLYRSDDPYLASAADMETLRRLAIRTVVDMRVDEEVAERGSARWDRIGAEVRSLVLIQDLPTPEETSRYTDPSHTADLYMRMATSDWDTQRLIWQTLADATTAATLIHCASGRDRTGVMVALVLATLGVDDSQIEQDYSMSGAGMARLLTWLAGNRPDALRHIHGDHAILVLTPPEAIRLFLARFRDSFGSISDYVGLIGIEDSVETLRRNLLEP
jgi:hypothetical protein